MSQFMLCKSEYDLSGCGGTSLAVLQENKELYRAMVRMHHPNLSDETFWVMDIHSLCDEVIEAADFTTSKLYSTLSEIYIKCNHILLWYGDEQEGLPEFHTRAAFFDYVKDAVANPCCELYANVMIDRKYTCPCCGNNTLIEQPPGTYEICPLCNWEDDEVQFNDPAYAGGANRLSLEEARRQYQAGRKE